MKMMAKPTFFGKFGRVALPVALQNAFGFFG
jgi:hypothetical protein